MSITGLNVRTHCKCGGDIATIDGDHILVCTSCNQRAGIVSPLGAVALESLVQQFGAPAEPVAMPEARRK
jgi:hypothetical protein